MSFLIGKRILLKEMSCEESYEVKVLAIVKDAGQIYYKVKIDGKTEYINANGVERFSMKLPPKKGKKLRLIE
jgi:hypothetical protein